MCVLLPLYVGGTRKPFAKKLGELERGGGSGYRAFPKTGGVPPCQRTFYKQLGGLLCPPGLCSLCSWNSSSGSFFFWGGGGSFIRLNPSFSLPFFCLTDPLFLFSPFLPLPHTPQIQAPPPRSASPSPKVDGGESPQKPSGPPGKELKRPPAERGSPCSPATAVNLDRSPGGQQKAQGGSRVEEDQDATAVVVLERTPQSPALQPTSGAAPAAAKGSVSSIPFIDCSDGESEAEGRGARVARSRSPTLDRYEGDPSSGVYLLSGDQPLRGCWPPSIESSGPPSRDFLEDDSDLTFELSDSPDPPRHSSLLIEEMFRGSGSRSPLATPLSPHSRSSSPSLSWDQAGSQGYGSENGEKRGVEEQGAPEENCSPVLPRPYLRTLPSRYNKSETDPLILSLVGSPSEALESGEAWGNEIPIPGGLAASQGRILTNGSPLVAPTAKGPTGGASGKRDQLAPLQVTEGSTSSGSESNDSEADRAKGPLSQALVIGNTAVLNSPALVQRQNSLVGSRRVQEREENE